MAFKAAASSSFSYMGMLFSFAFSSIFSAISPFSQSYDLRSIVFLR